MDFLEEEEEEEEMTEATANEAGKKMRRSEIRTISLIISLVL